MYMDERLLTYWQAGIVTLEHFYSSEVNIIEIPEIDCENGKVSADLTAKIWSYAETTKPAQLLNNTLDKTIKVVVAPRFITKQQETTPGKNLYILCLYAEITKTGQILPCKTEPLPWVPRILTEPTVNAPFSLGDIAVFDHYYHFSPPSWEEDGPSTWQEQLEYAHAFLEGSTKGLWEAQAVQLGYNLAKQVAVFPVIDSCLGCDLTAGNNHVAKRSLLEVAKKRKIWTKVFAAEDTAEAKLSISNKKVYKNSFLHAAHINSKHSLSMQQRRVLLQALLLEPNEILYIKSGSGTGKTTVAQDFIASKWVQAIIDNCLPPSIAIVNKSKQVQKFTILDLVSASSAWLSKYQLQLLYNVQPANIVQKENIIAQLLQQCSNEFSKEVANLAEAKALLRERVMLLQTALTQGTTAAYLYYEVTKELDVKYEMYGGIEQRNRVIQEALEKQQAYSNYLAVLQSLWNKMLLPASQWRQWLEKLPLFKRQKTEKLRNFFAKHLPDEDANELNVLQMQTRLQELILKEQKQTHNLEDILSQLKIDIDRLSAVKEHTKQVVPTQSGKTITLSKLIRFLDTHLRYRLFLTAIHYWEVELLQNIGQGYTDIFSEYYTNNYLQITDLIMQPVDWLLVENTENLSPIEGFYCIEGGNHLIVMGDNDAIVPCRIPIEIDINLLRQHGLLADEDAEELQFKGLLIANGQFSILVEQIADYKGVIYSLNKQWDTAPKLIECQNQLSRNERLQPCKKNKPSFIREFSFLQVTGCRTGYLGSFCNDAEVVAIIEWIQQHEVHIIACYPEYSLANAIVIYTPFYGQCQALQQALQAVNLNIKVELLQTIQSKRYPIVVFSPVYTNADKGDLCFEQGEQMLRNLLVAAKEHILVIGERTIFNANLCSASGKFAKFLTNLS